MQQLELTDGRQSRLYVLRLWRERDGAPLRLALRRAGCDELLGFASLDELIAFLADESEGWGAGEPAEPPRP